MPHFDLTAIAAEAGKDDEPFTFSVKGETFELPSRSDLEWAHKVLLMEDARRGLRAIWGDEEYNRFVRTRVSDREFEALGEKYRATLGAGSRGESSGSTGS